MTTHWWKCETLTILSTAGCNHANAFSRCLGTRKPSTYCKTISTSCRHTPLQFVRLQHNQIPATRFYSRNFGRFRPKHQLAFVRVLPVWVIGKEHHSKAHSAMHQGWIVTVLVVSSRTFGEQRQLKTVAALQIQARLRIHLIGEQLYRREQIQQLWHLFAVEAGGGQPTLLV